MTTKLLLVLVALGGLVILGVAYSYHRSSVEHQRVQLMIEADQRRLAEEQSRQLELVRRCAEANAARRDAGLPDDDCMTSFRPPGVPFKSTSGKSTSGGPATPCGCQPADPLCSCL